MKKAVVLYATRTNETGKLAELIAEGMRAEGIDVTVARVGEIRETDLRLETCDALILGSPTYKKEMLPVMKAFLGALEKADLGSKVGGAFGAFGWSGEASLALYETMKKILKMKMMDKPLRVKSLSQTGGAAEARNYGKEAANVLKYGREIAKMMNPP